MLGVVSVSSAWSHVSSAWSHDNCKVMAKQVWTPTEARDSWVASVGHAHQNRIGCQQKGRTPAARSKTYVQYCSMTLPYLHACILTDTTAQQYYVSLRQCPCFPSHQDTSRFPWTWCYLCYPMHFLLFAQVMPELHSRHSVFFTVRYPQKFVSQHRRAQWKLEWSHGLGDWYKLPMLTEILILARTAFFMLLASEGGWAMVSAISIRMGLKLKLNAALPRAVKTFHTAFAGVWLTFAPHTVP